MRPRERLRNSQQARRRAGAKSMAAAMADLCTRGRSPHETAGAAIDWHESRVISLGTSVQDDYPSYRSVSYGLVPVGLMNNAGLDHETREPAP